MGNINQYLERIMKILRGTESDIETILDELWEEAFEFGKREGYNTGFGVGQEKGRQEILDDPKKFELGNCDDCEERRHSDEPSHNEGYD